MKLAYGNLGYLRTVAIEHSKIKPCSGNWERIFFCSHFYMDFESNKQQSYFDFYMEFDTCNFREM